MMKTLLKDDAKFLVTGGAGFIGSNLCEYLLNCGCVVRCLDNLSTGSMKNVDMFMSNYNYEFINGDIRDFELCKVACEGIDYVLHHAALGSVPQSIESPLLYCNNNTTGTLNMLEASRISGVKKFIYASSSAVYGNSNDIKEGKEGSLLSPYAVCKRSDEEWAKQYTIHYGLDTYGLRYFNVFGKRQNPNGAYAAVIPKFITQLMLGETPVIYGDGEQRRDFTYINNVIEANIKACLADSSVAGEVYNIGFGSSDSLNEVFDFLVDILNVQKKPIYAPERPGDIKYSCADITKAQEKLGYNPYWSFKKGVQDILAWYKTNLTDYNK